jgi:hypothetical protein
MTDTFCPLLFQHLATHPEFLSVQILPSKVKMDMQDKIRSFVNKHELSNSSFDTLIQFLNGDQEHLVSKFMKYNDKLDNIRNERIVNTMPELRCIYEEQ